MARIPYVEKEDLPDEYKHLLYTHLEDTVSDVSSYSNVENRSGRGLRHVYQLLGNNPELLSYHRNYITKLWNEVDITSRERELIVLTSSRKTQSQYEWQHHVPVALDEGLTDEEIKSISEGNLEPFDEGETTLINYTTEFLKGDVSDQTHNRLAEYYSDSETILGIGMIAGFYQWHALIIDALDGELETEFIGWDLENL